jgi:hypothetical protein
MIGVWDTVGQALKFNSEMALVAAGRNSAHLSVANGLTNERTNEKLLRPDLKAAAA